MNPITYLFALNPGGVGYGSPTMLLGLVLCAALIAASFVLRKRRLGYTQPLLKKLSKSWPNVALIFGLAGFVLVVSRVEGIQFFAMRFLWLLWAVLLGLYAYLQRRIFKSRYYEVLPKQVVVDPRDKYLPGKKSR
jgi:hypothetical protein